MFELKQTNKEFAPGTWRWAEKQQSTSTSLDVLVSCPSCGGVTEVIYPGAQKPIFFCCSMPGSSCGYMGEVVMG